MSRFIRNSFAGVTACGLIALATVSLVPTQGFAVTKVESLCTIGGQTEMTLRGQGLIVGLNGTGDSDANAATRRAVTAYFLKSGQQATPDELKKLDNYAVVELTATIPRTGIALGQTLNCSVSALGGVKSLRGGRLVLAGLALPNDRDATGDLYVSATAEGTIIVDDPLTPTVGTIPNGVRMARPVGTSPDSDKDFVELLIQRPYAGFRLANSIQKAINERFSLQGEIAFARSERSIVVQIPDPYRDAYVQFVSELMSVSVNEAGSHPRIVINSQKGTVVATRSVSISPVTFTHRNINVEIGDPFVAVQSDLAGGSPQQLNDLLSALNQLKVPPDDIIAIVRELYDAGSLHGQLVEN